MDDNKEITALLKRALEALSEAVRFKFGTGNDDSYKLAADIQRYLRR